MEPPVAGAPTATRTTEEKAPGAGADDIIGCANVGIPCPTSSPPAEAVIPRCAVSTSALADAQSNVDAQSNEANEVHEVAPSGDAGRTRGPA